MSKVLYVLRHAQSAGKQSGQRDFDRELSSEGIAESRSLGKELKSAGVIPSAVLSSSAVRAKQTVQFVNESLAIPPLKIQFKDELYETLMAQCLDLIAEVPEAMPDILLVGHNPWLSMLASTLCSRAVDLAPCELVAVRFETDAWENLKKGMEIMNIKPAKA